MTWPSTGQPDIVSLDELASAAGVPPDDVWAAVARGEIRATHGYVAFRDAVHAGRRLRATMRQAVMTTAPAPLFSGRKSGPDRSAALPVAVSGLVHGTVAGLVVLLTMTLGATAVVTTDSPADPMRLVYLIQPGPGGGGGGGGLRQPLPPRRAARKGERKLDSPLPPPPPKVDPAPEPPKPVEAAPLPPVQAPVVVSPSNDEDKAGVMEHRPAETPSQGSGTGGGAGTGNGTGMGEGEGSGIGPGSGGGTGGGPYRPGSGIEPPRLLREVRPEYTEEARRAGLQGDVVLEIVVRHDGTVGEVRVLQGLGRGLDGRAIEAVRQWRFSPARRLGSPVDVLVEVAVEFKLR